MIVKLIVKDIINTESIKVAREERFNVVTNFENYKKMGLTD